MIIRAVSRRFAIPHATRSSAVQLAPSSTRSPRLRPHGATVNPELLRKRDHADSLRAGCSHSVYFLVREACSRSLLWFHRRIDQRVVGLALGVGVPASALIPRGNEPLDPWSPVPAVLHCAHRMREPPDKPGVHAFCASPGIELERAQAARARIACDPCATRKLTGGKPSSPIAGCSPVIASILPGSTND